MVKSGLPVRYKNGNKSNYVRRGPNYHIPLRNPCEQKNPTDCHFSPDYNFSLPNWLNLNSTPCNLSYNVLPELPIVLDTLYL